MTYKTLFAIWLLFLLAACQPRPVQEKQVGDYTISFWEDQKGPSEYYENNSWPYARIAVISHENLDPIIVEGAYGFFELPELDITGDGDPDVMFRRDNHNRHGCKYALYNLGEKPEALLCLGSGDQSSTLDRTTPFLDLNQDGVYEIMGFHNGMECSNGSTKMILGYENGRYVHVGAQYPEHYQSFIDSRAKVAQGELNAGYKMGCGAIGLMLAYYHSGQQEAGWLMMEQYYTKEEIEEFREEIEKGLAISNIYFSEN